MENVGTVNVFMATCLLYAASETVPTNVIALLDHMALMSSVRQLPRAHRAEQSRANYEKTLRH
jgi:hypothetical protein